MRRRASCPRFEACAAQAGLRIASYNIHGARGTDGRLDVPRIACVIGELDCDTVGLQEVNSRHGGREAPQLDQLAQLTGMAAIPGLTIVHADGHYGNALLTRRPVQAVRRHDLSYARAEPRGALEVVLEVEGEPVHVIVTHLGLRPAERRYQVRRMLELLHDLPKAQPVVVLGDINEWLPLGRPLRWLHELLGHPPAERSFPVACPLFALDRVWVRPRPALRAFGVFRSPTARRASDHYPVRALIDVHHHTRRVPHA